MLSSEQLLINFIFDINMHDGGDLPQELVDFMYKHISDSEDKYSLTHTPVTKHDIPAIDLTGSDMIPRNVAQDMKSYTGHVRKVVVNFTGICLPMTFFIYSPHPTHAIRELLARLPAIRWLGDTHIEHKKTPCEPDPLVVHLFMGDRKKHFPETVDTTITCEHCNAAVTLACRASGEILIYRKEEWGKTLIHELFHALCLDMVDNGEHGDEHESEINSELKRIFHLPGKPMFRETYCELWATILYCAVIAHNHVRETDTATVHNFKPVFRECVEIERHHSFIQMAKILRFWKVDWCDFLKHHMCKNTDVDRVKRNIPKEGTNVFCYFILRCVLMHDIGGTFRMLKPTIKRSFDPKPFATYIQKVAYGDEFENDILSHDRATQVILSRVHKSRMDESHKSIVVSHLTGNFRMSALSGWMI